MTDMDNASSPGIVYVLNNPAMPGLVKISKTARDSVTARLSELYQTGVAVPFECTYAARVDDVARVERAFHLAFGPYRLNPKREFFEIEPEQAIALLEILAIEDVTPTLQSEAAAVDRDAADASRRLKSRRPNLNFEEMGIPVGSVLQLIPNPDETVTVCSVRKVQLGDEEISLSAATRQLLGLSYSVAPGPYWTFDGRVLREIYNEIYGSI